MIHHLVIFIITTVTFSNKESSNNDDDNDEEEIFQCVEVDLNNRRMDPVSAMHKFRRHSLERWKVSPQHFLITFF